ncbi:MAG TPA: DUF5985 family protein [Gemmatimonadaceae bacterium]|nr:DUF5985 family protein [Gemmatimonadaceae bacterium]
MTNTQQAALFISGLLTSGYAVAALFFLRFWRRTGDRLFAFFSASFALLVVQRVLLAWAASGNVDADWLYLVRLLAFALILFAIIDKNRVARR